MCTELNWDQMKLQKKYVRYNNSCIELYRKEVIFMKNANGSYFDGQ